MIALYGKRYAKAADDVVEPCNGFYSVEAKGVILMDRAGRDHAGWRFEVLPVPMYRASAT